MNKQSVLENPYELKLPCIKVRQPIGEFFIASISSKDLCEITFADVRRMYQEREVETYLGIQRPLSPVRVKEIGQYVNTVDACFPTAVILAVDGRCAEFNETSGQLILRSNLESEQPEERITSIKIARVLDGQHRIEGLRSFSGPLFEINVSIFIDMDIESQAYVFSTVNLAQTKVNKSLVYDLFEYARSRSPQKTCHNIAVALDSLDTSPLFKRIKRLGSATRGRFNETLTQASFVESLLPYVTNNKIEDRDLYLRGKRPARTSQDQGKKLIFRNMFIDEQDMQIADVLLNYFEAIRKRWPAAWDSKEEGIILGKTNGFRALMRLLRPVYLRVAKIGEIPQVNDFSALLAKATMENADFNVENFKPGTSGEAGLYQRLLSELGLSR